MDNFHRGSTIQNRYRLDHHIGQGGMGTVYQAHDLLLGRDVALKILFAEMLSSESSARLLAEAQAAAHLNHPNIVTVFDAGEADGVPYIVMELVQGKNLHELGQLSIDEIISLSRQICAALEHAHANGIIHRDLKPENVFLTQSQTIKLVDFGLARSSDAPHLTQAGALVGTFAYLAPELIIGDPASPQSDLYALGILLYELITGQLPFTGNNPAGIISQHLHVTPVPPSTFNPGIPHTFENLVMQLLSKKPSDRPASAGDVIQTLDAIAIKPGSQTDFAADVSLLDRIVRGKLIGRGRELSEAISAWSKAVRGESNVLLISGEPGIGKTRLSKELCTLVTIQHGLVLQGECYAEGGLPYTPIAQILSQAFPEYADEAIMDLPGHVLYELASLAPELYSYFPDIPPNPPLEPAAEQLRLFESVTRFTIFLASKTPVLWLIDDIHWADSGTLSLIRHMARRLKRQRVMIMLNYREVELSEGRALNEVLAALNHERLADRIKLTRFSREQTREMLGSMFAEEITPEFLDGIYQETEGNPFFIEEVCKSLIEDGLLYRRDGHWQRPGMDQIRVPQSVRIALENRLQKLPSEVQDTLRMAAVLGREFDFGTLQRASDLNEDALIEILETSERAQLIEETRQRPREVRFSFIHALIPAALREGISVLRLQRLHRRAAAALESTHPQEYEVLAYHYAQGGEEEAARRYYRLAAERAYQTGAFSDAEKYYRLALELAEKPVDKANILEALSITYSAMSSYQASILAARQAIQIFRNLGDLDSTGRLYWYLSWTLWHSSDVPAGLAASREGMQLLAGQADSPGKTALMHELARQLYFNDQVDEARVIVQEALRAAQVLGIKRLQAHCLTTLALTQPLTDSINTLHQAIDIAHTIPIQSRDVTFGTGISRALNNLAEILTATGQFEQASDIVTEMAAHNRGAGAGESWALAAAARIELELGNLTNAARILDEARRLIQPESGQIQTMLAESSARLGLFQGDIAGAQETYLRTFTQGIDHKDQQAVLRSAAYLLESYLVTGEWVEASLALEQVMPIVERGQLAQWEAGFFFAGDAIVQAMLGHVERAKASLLSASCLAGEQPYPLQSAEISQAKAYLAMIEERWQDCFDSFENLVKLNTTMNRRWHQAESLRQWADAHLQRDQADDRHKASELLAQAVEIFEQLGAGKPARRAQLKMLALVE